MATANKARYEKEIWKSPPSLNKWWVEVSNLGRVRSLSHRVDFVNVKRVEVSREELGMIRKPAKDSRGRWQVFLCNGKKLKGYLLHRLVAECFVENLYPKKYTYVFFKNGDNADCRAANLEWGDIRDKGYMQKGHGAKHLVKIYDNGVLVGEYVGIGEAADVLECSKQAVFSAMKEGRLCKGFIVKYTKLDGRAVPRKKIEDGRNGKRRTFEFIKIPDSIFSNENIDIQPKAVF